MTSQAAGKFLSRTYALCFVALAVVGAAMLVMGQDSSLYLAAG